MHSWRYKPTFTSLVRLTLLSVTIWGLPSATKHHSHRNGLYKPSRQLEVYSWVYNITYFFSTPKIDRTVRKCSEPGMREASSRTSGKNWSNDAISLGTWSWNVSDVKGNLDWRSLVCVKSHWELMELSVFYSLNLFGGWECVWLESYGDGWTPNIAFFRGTNIH
jgi:hypothetical protein